MSTSMPASDVVATKANVDQIAAFMRNCSFEATRPAAKDIAALRETLAPGTPVYLTMLPNHQPGECVDNACAIRNAGLTPIPHLAVRHLASLDAADQILADLNAKAGVTRVLLIGGDTKTPMGSIPNVLALIESGILQRNRISDVGVAGFPDGHPVLNEDELEANLVTKLAAIQSGGLEGRIVTQFVFDAAPVIRWISWLRRRGLHAPIHVGLAGPTSLMAWLNFARKCGVKASAEALAQTQWFGAAGVQIRRTRSDHPDTRSGRRRTGPCRPAPVRLWRHRRHGEMGATGHARCDRPQRGWRL